MSADELTRDKRAKNLLKWGEQNHPDGTRRTAERTAARAAAQARTDAGMKNGTVTYLDILQEEVAEAACETDEAKLLGELIDVAAVAQDWADSILRRVRARAQKRGAS